MAETVTTNQLTVLRQSPGHSSELETRNRPSTATFNRQKTLRQSRVIVPEISSGAREIPEHLVLRYDEGSRGDEAVMAQTHG